MGRRLLIQTQCSLISQEDATNHEPGQPSLGSFYINFIPSFQTHSTAEPEEADESLY